jgi:hypothetical protein
MSIERRADKGHLWQRASLVAVAAIMLTGLAIHQTTCQVKRDALDRRTEEEALAEAAWYMELDFPPGIIVLGYCAGLDERFLKIVANDAELSQMVAQTRCREVGYMPRIIDGMDPSGISDWWQPRAAESCVAYEGDTPRQPGRLAIVVDVSEMRSRTVYLYCFRP